MTTDIRELEPKAMWNCFADLNEVPRPSKNEARVIEFVKGYGESLGLDTHVDAVGNVIICKPASPGMESRATIVLQSHLDMVWQKNADTDFDFETQGIDMFIDGDWVRARGTTLGADNGIGVASIMALLGADDIPHPPLEALFTIDEETGMTGAKELKAGELSGNILLNLDTEDDNELAIGCAGGADVTATRTYQPEATPADTEGFRISFSGLKGGHSGMDIHLGRGNANKLMNRWLWHAAKEFDLRVSEIDGGGLRNAIPRESFSMVNVRREQAAAFHEWGQAFGEIIRQEYATTDPQFQFLMQASESLQTVLPAAFQQQVLGALYVCPSGIGRMCPEFENLVQTSNNMARVLIKDGSFTCGCLTRSSVDSERDSLAASIQAGFELIDAKVVIDGDYPGWQPKPHSAIVELMANLYQEMFSEPALVAACHAGLECGIIGTNYPDMQMISFGPNIRGAHSPDECVQISSVQKYWRFLLETLRQIPVDLVGKQTCEAVGNG